MKIKKRAKILCVVKDVTFHIFFRLFWRYFCYLFHSLALLPHSIFARAYKYAQLIPLNEWADWRKRRGKKNIISCIRNSTSSMSVSYGPMQMKSIQMDFVVYFFITFFLLWIVRWLFSFILSAPLNTSARCGYCILSLFLYCELYMNGDLLLFIYSLVLCQFIEFCFCIYSVPYVDFDLLWKLEQNFEQVLITLFPMCLWKNARNKNLKSISTH